MSFKINFNSYNSVFAVPTALVDKHIKLATESQLKVLLYVLRNSGSQNPVDDIAKAVLVHPEEVTNAINFWIDRGVFVADTNNIEAKPDTKATDIVNIECTSQTTITQPKKTTQPSRLQRPDISYVANMLSRDSQLADLMNEVEFTLSKVLSSADKATIVMIKETLGLPCEVIIMLVNFCVSNGKPNMRAIEKVATVWSDKGIFTIEDAERMIENSSASKTAWAKVSKIFGIKNIGLPTDAQLSYADTWCNEWKFSDDMLLEAYTRCVNSKGEYNIRYINGILKKWYADKIMNLDDLQALDSKSKTRRKKAESNDSFDIETFESKSLFND